MKLTQAIPARCVSALALLALLPGVASAGTIVVASTFAYVANLPSGGGALTPLVNLPDGTSGLAYDTETGTLYVGGDYGATINGVGVTGAAGSLLDMAFAEGFIWAADSNTTDSASLDMIDPETMQVVAQYSLGFDSVPTELTGAPTFSAQFMASGVAWDGTGFWISNNPIAPDDFGAGVLGTSIQKYELDDGVLTAVEGSSFQPWLDTWTLNSDGSLTATGGRNPGGLAWSSTNTLLVGTDNGEIWSIDPSNPSARSLFATSPDGGFVQSFEVVPSLEAVPEPGTFALFGTALAGCLALLRRRRSQSRRDTQQEEN